MAPVILVLLVIGSAVGVVLENYYCRDLFMEIQSLEMKLEDCEIESGQLQLEKTTLAGYGRVERAASAKIGLIRPPRDSIVYIKTSPVKGSDLDE